VFTKRRRKIALRWWTVVSYALTTTTGLFKRDLFINRPSSLIKPTVIYVEIYESWNATKRTMAMRPWEGGREVVVASRGKCNFRKRAGVHVAARSLAYYSHICVSFERKTRALTTRYVRYRHERGAPVWKISGSDQSFEIDNQRTAPELKSDLVAVASGLQVQRPRPERTYILTIPSNEVGTSGVLFRDQVTGRFCISCGRFR